MNDLVFCGASAAAMTGEDLAVARKNGRAELPESIETAYRCAVLRALTGMELRRAGDLDLCLQTLENLPEISGVEDAVSRAGLTALLYAELRSWLRKVKAVVSDAVIRSLGVSLITGDIPGIALIMGSADCAAHVSVLAEQYRASGLIVMQAGADCGADDAAASDKRRIYLGELRADVVDGISAAAGIAEIFCGVTAGSGAALINALRERICVVLNVFGVPDAAETAMLTGAAALGVTVVTDGAEVPGAAVFRGTAEELAAFSMERRGVKVKPQAVSLPVAYDTAYEGEKVRENCCGAEFPNACELVRMCAPDEIKDHEIRLVGTEIPAAEEKVTMHLAILAEVSGKRMQREFESVIERRIHYWLCCAEGVEHRGKRAQVDLRISRESLRKGLRLSDLAETLYRCIRSEFEPVVDKCRITLITDAEKADQFAEKEALPCYQARDARLASLTDESVENFYTCTMCQSIAPRHCCVVTPEREGMCGAVTWPDARATYELVPTGPNRPVAKGTAADARLGRFDSVDRAAADATAGAVQAVSLYSMMDNPMTGCGRLECICGVETYSGGVVIADRDYDGMTPAGMTFADMADTVFGGGQAPGFMGIGRRYIYSEKFIRADGGALRIVWMTKRLKDEIAVLLNRTVKKLYGIEDFCGMVGDETVTTDPEALYAFLSEKGHPVLGMDPII